MISFKGRHFQKEMILQSIRWYLAYSLSYRDIEDKNFHAAQQTLAGIELMAVLKQGQMKTTKGDNRSPAELFYALAA